MDLASLAAALTSVSFALIVGMLVAYLAQKEKCRVESLLEKKITQDVVNQKRTLELREMFDVSEPEWHILNEMAGQKPYHVQNQPLRRIVKDWSEYEPDWVGCEAEPDPEIFALPPTVGTWQRRPSDELEEY